MNRNFQKVIYFGTSELKEETFKELLPYFFEEINQDLITIKAAIQENNIENTRLLAHRIKGTAVSYNATLIHQAAKNIHDFSDLPNTDELQKLFTKLEAAIHESHKFAVDEFGI